jgi:tellurite resistance protein
MKTAVVVLLVLIVVAPVIALGIMYWQYLSWPPRLWKRRVLRRVESLLRDRNQLRRAGNSANETDRLYNEYLRRHLQSISLHVLDKYPGIGPATVGRLVDGGYTRLSDISNARFESIPGIGPTRAAALSDAVRTLVQEARSRFEAGSCPEALEFRRRVEEVRAAEQEKAEARARELSATDVALKASEELHEIARGISFWTYLFHRDEAGVSDSVMARPLPVVVVPPPPPPPVPVARVVAVPPPIVVAKPSVAAKPAVRTIQPAPPEGVSREQVPPRMPSSAVVEPHPWLPRMRAFCRFAFAVAKSDGRIAQSERNVIRSFLAAKFGHQETLARHIDPMMEQVEAALPTEVDVLAEVRPATTEAERRELYRLAEQIADAAGERKQRESEALQRIAQAFGITVSPQTPVPDWVEVVSASRKDPPKQRPVAPRELLEIPAGAELSPELIRRRFAMLSDRIDPAKAREMGPEFARMAEEKLAHLRAAAETLIAPFKEPLEKPNRPPPPADLRHNPDLDDVFGG